MGSNFGSRRLHFGGNTMFLKEKMKEIKRPLEGVIRFNNYAKKIEKKDYGYDWYRWRVFVDENKETLDKIDFIEYLLHKSFPKSKRIVRNRETKFALDSVGWGEFYIFITIHFKDGEKKEQRYYLSFDKKWPEEHIT